MKLRALLVAITFLPVGCAKSSEPPPERTLSVSTNRRPIEQRHFELPPEVTGVR
jgi:hypothetical protein